MNIITIGHHYIQECRGIIMQFYPTYKIFINESRETTLKIIVSLYDGKINLEYYEKEILISNYNENIKQNENTKKIIKRKLVLFITKQTGIVLPWGILTGIRPVKIPHKLLVSGYTSKDVENLLVKEYLLSSERAKLITKLAKKEIKIVYPLSKKKAMIYIGIPFCPSRCHYCSFVSETIQCNRELFTSYLEALKKEVECILNYLNERNIIIQNVYIGGGTPSVLNNDELKHLFQLLSKHLNLKSLKELTFEAGRPETITKDKLDIMKSFGVNRISINPQSLNDDTLQRIGRNHSSKDFL